MRNSKFTEEKPKFTGEIPNHNLVLSMLANSLSDHHECRTEVVEIGGVDIKGNSLKGVYGVKPADVPIAENGTLFSKDTPDGTSKLSLSKIWTEKYRVILFGLIDVAGKTKSHELIFTREAFDQLLKNLNLIKHGSTNITTQRMSALQALEAMEGVRLSWLVEEKENGEKVHLHSQILSVSVVDKTTPSKKKGSSTKIKEVKVTLGDWYPLVRASLNQNETTLITISDKIALSVIALIKIRLKRIHPTRLKKKGGYLTAKTFAINRGKLKDYEEHPGKVRAELIASMAAYVETQGQNLEFKPFTDNGGGVRFRDLNPIKSKKVTARGRSKPTAK